MQFSKEKFLGNWRVSLSLYHAIYPISFIWATGLCHSGEKSTGDRHCFDVKSGLLACGLVAQPVASLLLGSTWIFSLGGRVLGVLSQGWKMEKSRQCAFTWSSSWWPSTKGPWSLVFLWEMGFFSLSSPALCRASILLLYSESTRCFLIDSHWSAHTENIPRVTQHGRSTKFKSFNVKVYMKWRIFLQLLITRLPFKYFYFKSILGNFFGKWEVLDLSVSLLGRMASNIFTSCYLMIEMCLPTALKLLVCCKVK